MEEPPPPDWVKGDLTDPELFRAFYVIALPRVQSYLYRRCNLDLDLTEDLGQDVFMAIVNSLRNGTVVADPIPWAVGIARHKLLDHLRRQRRVGWTLVPIDDVPSDELTDEEALASLSPGGERAMSALSKVPSPQRDALMLRYFDGLSATEIALALDRTVSAVESLLVRGRIAFRRNFLGGTHEA